MNITNIVLTNVAVMPNYAKGRYQSGHADGFQVSNCRGHIVVDGCKFEGLMDDPINVHGTSVKIIEIKDRIRLMCRFMEGMSTGMTWGRAGERVGFGPRRGIFRGEDSHLAQEGR